jgi:hypothetical protein
MRRFTRVTTALVAAIAAVGLGMTATATAEGDHSRSRRFRAFLAAANELPIVISDARGRFFAEFDDSGTEPVINWRLSYTGLEADVTQAHIHASQPGFNGGIMIWLCSNLTTPPTLPPGATPLQACPLREGELSGTIKAADVVGPTGQAIPVGDFDDALEAIRGGNSYANVHSGAAPGGELRGQIR